MVKARGHGRERNERLRRWGNAVQKRIGSTQARIERSTLLEKSAGLWAKKAFDGLEKIKPGMHKSEIEEIWGIVRNAEKVITEAIENWDSLIKNQRRMAKDAEKATGFFSQVFNATVKDLETQYMAKIGRFQEILDEINAMKREKGLG